MDILIAHREKFRPRRAIGCYIKDPHEYPVLSVFTQHVQSGRVVHQHHKHAYVFGTVLLSYVCTVTTLCVPTLSMHAYSLYN